MANVNETIIDKMKGAVILPPGSVITLSADPVNPLDAATKQYVDNSGGGGGGGVSLAQLHAAMLSF